MTYLKPDAEEGGRKPYGLSVVIVDLLLELTFFRSCLAQSLVLPDRPPL